MILKGTLYTIQTSTYQALDPNRALPGDSLNGREKELGSQANTILCMHSPA
jgi:hypothetical protein